MVRKFGRQLDRMFELKEEAITARRMAKRARTLARRHPPPPAHIHQPDDQYICVNPPMIGGSVAVRSVSPLRAESSPCRSWDELRLEAWHRKRRHIESRTVVMLTGIPSSNRTDVAHPFLPPAPSPHPLPVAVAVVPPLPSPVSPVSPLPLSPPAASSPRRSPPFTIRQIYPSPSSFTPYSIRILTPLLPFELLAVPPVPPVARTPPSPSMTNLLPLPTEPMKPKQHSRSSEDALRNASLVLSVTHLCTVLSASLSVSAAVSLSTVLKKILHSPPPFASSLN